MHSVYVMHAIGTNKFKIGFSLTPSERVLPIRRDARKNPRVGEVELEIIATYPGAFSLEFAVHEHLKQWAIGKEWFEIPENPLALVQEAVDAWYVKLEESCTRYRALTQRKRLRARRLKAKAGR